MRLPVETVDGRPALHLRPRMENNTKDQAGNIRHMTYQMEMASKCAVQFASTRSPTAS